jgi:hypothetical protein
VSAVGPQLIGKPFDRPPSMTSPTAPKLENSPLQAGSKVDVSFLGAFQAIFGIVPRIGGAVIGIAAIAYLVGWRTASAYYGAFGTEWITSLLSASELLLRSYGLPVSQSEPSCHWVGRSL